MRKTELTVSGEVIHPKTKASIVSHEHTNVESYLNQQNRTSSVITQSSATSQVGLGDEVDLSFCVEDGFYESATLYGRTLVNCIQEPSSQDVILPYEFTEGQYVTINDTKESGALGVELKGRTLVNLNKTTYPVANWGTNKNNNNYYHDYDTLKSGMLKQLTNYLFKIYGLSNPQEIQLQGTLNVFTDEIKRNYRFNENGCLILTSTKTILDFSRFTPHFKRINVNNLTANEMNDLKMIILEYQEGMENWDIPYFEGMASVKNPKVRTISKNFLSLHNDLGNTYGISRFHDGGFTTSKMGKYGAFGCIESLCEVKQEWLDKNPISVQKGKVYTFSCEIRKVSGTSTQLNYLRLTGFNKAGDSYCWTNIGWWNDELTFNYDNVVKLSKTVTCDCSYKHIVLAGQVTAESTDDVYEITKIQLEEAQTASTYEATRSSTLNLVENNIVLRSLPNGVCDTYNTRTGEYVQRVGEIVLNGSDIITSSIDFNLLEVLTNTSRCYIGFHTMASKVNMKPYSDSVTTTPQLICDSLPVKEGIPSLTSTDSECVGQTNSGFSIRLRGKSIEECRNRLSQNPVTIQYELKTPIITKMIPQSTLKSWDTTTHIYSEIPENSLYPILSHLNPTYPVILKPSTKYSIVANSYNNSHTNPTISFNLGGATASITAGNRVVTITTPSTLSNELLTMSGRGNKLNNVMVIEGDIVGDEPYFEGICDCKSPILANVGKNLFDGKIKRGIALGGSGLEVGNRDRASSDFIKVKPSTSYRLSGINIKAILAFDDKKIVVGNMGITGEIITPANTEYIRFTCVNEDILNAMLVENSFQATYEPHKSNVLSCNGDKINLTEDMFEQGTTGEFSANIGATYHSFKSDSNHRIRTKEIIKIKPNTTYSVICNDGYTTRIAGFDINGLCLSEIKSFSSNTTIITTSNNVHYICVVLSKVSGSISMSNFSQSGLEIREVDKAIVLRSLPNGVRDMLNVKTGEHVQRVGEVMLDGSEGESWSMPTNFSNGDCKGYSLNVDNLTSILICDSLNVLPNSQKYTTKEGVFASKGSIIIKKNLATRELLKEWLSQNPITVQYELETPIVSTVNVQGFPYAYKDGHIQLSSGHSEQSLTPKLEYVVQTNRTGAIQANQDRLINHEKRLMTLETMILHQLIQLEYRRAKSVFLSQTRQIFEGGIRMYHTKYDLLLEFIEKKLYRSLEEVLEMLDVYFMLGDLTDGEYDALYSVLFPMNEIDATEGEACDDSLETM